MLSPERRYSALWNAVFSPVNLSVRRGVSSLRKQLHHLRHIHSSRYELTELDYVLIIYETMKARLLELQAAPTSQHAFNKSSGKTSKRPGKAVTAPYNRPQLPSTISYPFRHSSYHPTGQNLHKNLRCQQKFFGRGGPGRRVEMQAINLSTDLSLRINRKFVKQTLRLLSSEQKLRDIFENNFSSLQFFLASIFFLLFNYKMIFKYSGHDQMPGFSLLASMHKIIMHL